MKRLIWSAGLILFGVGMGMAAGIGSAGKADYDKYCKGCHGPDGTPNAAIEKTFNVTMLSLSDPAVQRLRDDELKTVIESGKGKMKSVKSVTGNSADDVVAYLRTFKK